MSWFLVKFSILVLLGLSLSPTSNAGTSGEFVGSINWTARKNLASLCYSYTFTRADNGEQMGLMFDDPALEPENITSEKLFRINGELVEWERSFDPFEQSPIDPITNTVEPIGCMALRASKIVPLD